MTTETVRRIYEALARILEQRGDVKITVTNVTRREEVADDADSVHAS